ncbi:MAG: OmpA family protein [Chitinophagaceae bacterium]
MLQGIAQRQSSKKNNPLEMANFFFEKGKELVENKKLIDQGILAFLTCLNNDSNYLPTHKYLSMLYLNKKEYKKALASLEKVFQLEDSSLKIIYFPYYAKALAGVGNFKKAKEILEIYVNNPSIFEIDKKNFRRDYKNMLFADKFDRFDSVINITPITGEINSSSMEYEPCFTIDENNLYFTRNNLQKENIFVAQKKGNNIYKNPQQLVFRNPLSNEGSSSISMDGKSMVITFCQVAVRNGCNIYISRLTAEGWTKPESIGNEINSNFWESQPSLSPDKQQLYFVSNRPGGYGGKDIYVASLLSNGKYGKVKNLGKTINTPGDEQMPYMHADNETFYFTSNEWQGYGGDDLFMSKKIDDTTFSPPLNLGYPINTIDNETRIYVARDGRTAYYASQRDNSKGSLDIYSFPLHRSVEAIPIIAIKGKITNKNEDGIITIIKAGDLKDNRIIQQYTSSPAGNYLLTLPAGKEYNILVNKKNNLPYSMNLNLKNITHDTIINNIDIVLDSAIIGKSMILKNVYFKTDSFDIESQYVSELNAIVEFLKNNPNINIVVIGHTDNQGTENYNQKLSLRRSESIAQYFINMGIFDNRIKTEGKGFSKPINNNKNKEERSMNRRIEIKIIK